jgi:hypothetical protein
MHSRLSNHLQFLELETFMREVTAASQVAYACRLSWAKKYASSCSFGAKSNRKKSLGIEDRYLYAAISDIERYRKISAPIQRRTWSAGLAS